MPKWSCTFEDQQNLSTLLGYSTKCYIVRLIELQDLWNQCGDGPTNKHHQWVVDQPKWSARQLPVDSVDGTIMIQWKTWSTLGKKHIIVKKIRDFCLFRLEWIPAILHEETIHCSFAIPSPRWDPKGPFHPKRAAHRSRKPLTSKGQRNSGSHGGGDGSLVL